MTPLFHSIMAVSMAVTLVSSDAASGLRIKPSPYFGRWTVADPAKKFSARGKPYKTIDIAPCGKDFCGISVSDKGTCCAVLFRFLSQHSRDPFLRGHAPWGMATKNLQIEVWNPPETPGDHEMELYVGNSYDFGGRSDSMPKFDAVYKRTGEAACKAR